ncbi:MAG TPA: DUF1376 domain-containing protein, partial [Terricaulis sp.]|nr:DUF1376 domain-containing protein [Terricaulis sp.]
MAESGTLSNGEPLPPLDCDLRDFKFMPLDVARFRDSKFAAKVSDAAFRAGVMLWAAAWHQVPASSLPDDDVELASLAGFGRVVEAWLAVRDDALHGFEKGADGRLYHPVIAEKANEAWAAKRTQSKRGKSGAAARWGKGENGASIDDGCLKHSEAIAQ